MELRGNHLIVLASTLFPVTMIITFTMAVVSEHVYPIMPFISYTGDLPLESCIFSLGLNFIAVLYTIITYIRYNQVQKYCEEDDAIHVNTILRLNRNSLPWGITSSLGLSVTGSFQEIHMATIHRLGALVCTYSGFIYIWYHTLISDLLKEKLNSTRVSLVRTALSIASTTIHVVAPILVAILDLGYPKRHEDSLIWSMKEAGWHLHVFCSCMEWTIFLINVTYVATFYEEFKRIRIRKNEIVFTRQQGREVNENGRSLRHAERRGKPFR